MDEGDGEQPRGVGGTAGKDRRGRKDRREGQWRAVKGEREGNELVKQKASKEGRAEKWLKRWWSLVGLATAGAGCWRGFPWSPF